MLFRKYNRRHKGSSRLAFAASTMAMVAALNGCDSGGGGGTVAPATTETAKSAAADTPIAAQASASPQLLTEAPGSESTSMDNASNAQLQARASEITDLVLVTGQSNVTGANTEFNPSLDGINISVFAFNSDGQWRIADLHQAWDQDWFPGNDSLHDNTRQPFNNFALHFGKSVVQADNTRVVGVVVISSPGSGIAHWDRESLFYSQIADTATKALNAQGVKAQFDAVLWHQGETDWVAHGTSDTAAADIDKTNPNYYSDKLNALITNLRSENWMSDRAPFICGETLLSPVNSQLIALNTDDDPLTSCVEATDLTARPDDESAVHFSSEALRVIGSRYAEAYLQLTQ